jgi:5-methylcytosine-specific restriction endonuclease McrA
MKHYGYCKDDFIKCEECPQRANSTHHIIKKSQGGTDDIWNLIALCQPHHHKADNNIEFNKKLQLRKNKEFNI